MFKPVALAATTAALAFGATAASAATESWTFDATLSSGLLLCGEFVGDETSCPADFGLVDAPSDLDDLMLGMEIGGTYAGRVDLEWDDATSMLLSASCMLNGRDCMFSTDFVAAPGPLGATATVDFTVSGVVGSTFNFEAGAERYLFSTDYIFDEDDSLHYYADVRFDLTDVGYSTSLPEVPLPAGGLLLLSGLAGLAIRRFV